MKTNNINAANSNDSSNKKFILNEDSTRNSGSHNLNNLFFRDWFWIFYFELTEHNQKSIQKVINEETKNPYFKNGRLAYQKLFNSHDLDHKSTLTMEVIEYYHKILSGNTKSSFCDENYFAITDKLTTENYKKNVAYIFMLIESLLESPYQELSELCEIKLNKENDFQKILSYKNYTIKIRLGNSYYNFIIKNEITRSEREVIYNHASLIIDYCTQFCDATLSLHTKEFNHRETIENILRPLKYEVRHLV